MSKRCGNCGSKNTKEARTTGPFAWRDFPAIQIENGVDGIICQDCGEVMTSAAVGKEIDEQVSALIRGNVQTFIAEIIKREKATQIEISERLGVTPEYLSEIKSARKLPGFQTYNFLKTLALDPKAYGVSDPKRLSA